MRVVDPQFDHWRDRRQNWPRMPLLSGDKHPSSPSHIR